MQKRGILSFYFQSNLLYRILIALVLGVIVGILVPSIAEVDTVEIVNSIITPFGDLFIRLLKMITVPIIVCSLIIGTSSISPTHLGKVGVKAIIFYFFTTLFAIVIGLVCAWLLSPGSGLTLDETKAIAKTVEEQSISDILLGIIPTNPFQSIAKGEILPIITFCIFFGVSLAFCRHSDNEKVKRISNIMYDFFEAMSEIMFRVIKWVMEYAPIGVFALIFVVFSKNGAMAFGSLAKVTFTLYLGLILQVVLVYCGICLLIKLSPWKFLNKVKSPMITAFVTRSSNGTLPVSIQTTDTQMGVPKSIYSFVLPVGATINMNGTTVYLGVCTLFIANACGIDLSMSQYITIIITTILAAIGTAGVPGAGAIMLLLVLHSIGIKVEGNVAVAYGMILGIDALLDMGRTSMNVVGDVMASVWVAKTENELDMDKWK